MQYKYWVVLMSLFATAALFVPLTGLAQEEVVCESDVVVQEGDFLSKISAEAYGDPNLYPAIVAATNRKAETDSSYTTIDQTNLILPGWKLCIPGQEQAEALAFSPPAQAEMLTMDQLANATYSGIYTEPVTLSGGLYEGEPFVEGGAARPTVQLIDQGVVYGDLDGDGIEDAAVLLVENSGGSGVFTYVGAQLNQAGQPVDAGAVWVGDRTQVKSLAIENGQVIMEIVTQGPEDPQCCPTLKVRKTYAVQDGQLAEVGREDLGKISAADLNGTSWILVDLNFNQQQVLTGTEVTLNFQEGQISGSGGCNSYTGSFSLAEENPQGITMGPVAATRMACPEPVMNQETAYFQALERVVSWSYLAGQLALTYENAQGDLNTLLFAPQTAQTAAPSEAGPTEVIDFLLADIPSETQAGSCFTNAIGLGRADAWRCTVGNQIFDPCFAIDEAPTVVCGANPAIGETGFVLELTEPLPEPDPGNLSQPWLVELADGQVCGLMTGTVVGVGDRIAPYGCPDGSYLFEDFQQDQVWLAEKAVIGLSEDGYFIEQSEMVPISRVWR